MKRLLILALLIAGVSFAEYAGGGDSAQVTENTADITALEGDVDAFVGDITKSYVVLSGTSIDGAHQYAGMDDSHPSYRNTGDPLSISGVWTLYTDGYTNPATSYLPPYDGWMHNGTNVDVTVEWFSGQSDTKYATTNWLYYDSATNCLYSTYNASSDCLIYTEIEDGTTNTYTTFNN